MCASSAGMPAKAHPPIDKRDLLHRGAGPRRNRSQSSQKTRPSEIFRAGPVTIEAVPEAQKGEGLADGVRRVLFKDLPNTARPCRGDTPRAHGLAEKPVRIAVPANKRPERSWSLWSLKPCHREVVKSGISAVRSLSSQDFQLAST